MDMILCNTFYLNPYCLLLLSRYASVMRNMWLKFPVENTLVLASEDLEQSPAHVWRRIATAIGLSTDHPHLKEFGAVRYNAQVRVDRLLVVIIL